MNKAKFLVIARHCELIFCLLSTPKCDFDKVEKAMIQVFECHFEVIICFLTWDFYHVDEVDARHRVFIFFLLTSP